MYGFIFIKIRNENPMPSTYAKISCAISQLYPCSKRNIVTTSLNIFNINRTIRNKERYNIFLTNVKEDKTNREVNMAPEAKPIHLLEIS